MNKTFLRRGRVLLASTITALVLAACGGAGGDSPSALVPVSVTQAGVIVPSSMGGTAIVGQEYKGQIEVAPGDASVTVTSLSIVNNLAGGAQPSIDTAGNITWTPNDQDFTGISSLRVTGSLSNGAVISDNIPMDVRKVRVVVQKALADSKQIYSDDDGNYLISVTKKTTTSVISGELTITETYRKNGEFSWLFKATGDGFTTAILQAPATQRSPITSALASTATQVGVVQTYPITRLAVGNGYFPDLKENGSVIGHQPLIGSTVGGNNVYSSRPAGNVTYFQDNLNDVRSASLDGFPVFWFGANCTTSFDSTYAGKPLCASNAQAKSPIILIHGFSGEDNIAAWNESIVGGGVGTWGQTAKLLTDEGYPVFEMRWLSYMPFEDAAGALGKFGKDIAQITGKKPIILAHSFGGVVSHLALQNKGREWAVDRYGAGQWATVNTDRVFAKLITLNSPLSGINANGGLPFNPIKKIYDDAGALKDVAFPRGVDRTDPLIKRCYSITCAQAGAAFNNNGSFKTLAINKSLIDGYVPTLYLPPTKISIYDAEIIGGVARSLKEGESIANLQIGIAQNIDNAPYITVTGFKGNESISYYLGDGLISLMGQAAIPQDFSDQAFDGSPTPLFKFKFESTAYPTVLGKNLKFNEIDKGDCIKYDVATRAYLVCAHSAHTSSNVGALNAYPVANYSGLPGLTEVMPRLVLGVNYLATTPTVSPFSLTTSLASAIKGRLGASAAPKQVGLVGSTLTPVKFAVIWATIIEKSTGVSKHYFSGAQSDDAGQFNIDIGSVISNKFGSAAVLADYRVKLKIDVVGYKSWSQNIEMLDATVDLGDIDLSLTASSINSISPVIAKVGIATSFKIAGTNLPVTDHLDITFDGCANIQFVSQSAAQHQFTCTPTVAGTLTAVIRTLPGATPLGSFPVAVSAATAPPPTSLNLLLGATVTDSCMFCSNYSVYGDPNYLTDGNITSGRNLGTYSGSFNIFPLSTISIDRLVVYPIMTPNGVVTYEVQTSASPVGAAGTFTSHGIRSSAWASGVPFDILLNVNTTGVRVVKLIIHSSPSWVSFSEIQGFLGNTPAAFNDTFETASLDTNLWASASGYGLGTVAGGLLDLAPGAGVSTLGKRLFSGSKIDISTLIKVAGGSAYDTYLNLYEAATNEAINVGEHPGSIGTTGPLGLYAYGSGGYAFTGTNRTPASVSGVSYEYSGVTTTQFKVLNIQIDGNILTVQRGDQSAGGAITYSESFTRNLGRSIVGRQFYLLIANHASGSQNAKVDWIKVATQ